jgi:hypothetical protein
MIGPGGLLLVICLVFTILRPFGTRESSTYFFLSQFQFLLVGLQKGT